MEPIRPERDEVRGSAGSGKPKPGKTAARASRPGPELSLNRQPGRGAIPVLVVLLVAAVAAGGWGWYVQKQRIDQMSERLQEADYWARQSKLALARFEGKLSETGESLEEKDSSLASLQKQAKTNESEIRKLWAVANERNKDAINANKAALAYLEETTSTLKGDFNKRADTLAADIKSLQESAEERQAALKSLQTNLADLEPRLKTVEETADNMTATVEQRLDRFGREQNLARQEILARLDSLEKGGGDLAALKNSLASTRQRLGKIENAIDAIDAARAQLNARLIRLDDEVASLRK
ncbi:hypothetical protein EZI54_00530 [Marinobacter halodurans]|uniref:Chromosome partitioning protein ParA n=1 Tax=Marinobacter halodurans TaxID=2528979 RepID=A0ABY1ZT84_9GAMM|nr:hypothetical protein [Marinobacter halodurans]TBW59474.1 hypothetical protein EZI54_00530 [Marinobacter halodurans]